jgi:hypothetical protein
MDGLDELGVLPKCKLTGSCTFKIYIGYYSLFVYRTLK